MSFKLFSRKRKEVAAVTSAPPAITTTATPSSTSPFSSTNDFSSLGIRKQLVKVCTQLRIESPTAVQRACIPPILRGASVLGCAPTGSGKTVAYCLPILERLADDPFGVFALILLPSRELAVQVNDVVCALGATLRVRSALVVGGLNQMEQASQIDMRAHFIVGTPGRVAELMRSSVNDAAFGRCRFFVLDEADALLSSKNAQSFGADIKFIFKKLIKSRKASKSRPQMLFFTATPGEVAREVRRRAMLHTQLYAFMFNGQGDDLSYQLQLEENEEEEEEIEDDDDERRKKRRRERAEEQASDSTTSNKNDNKNNSLPLLQLPDSLDQRYIFLAEHLKASYMVLLLRALIDREEEARAAAAAEEAAALGNASAVIGGISKVGIAPSLAIVFLSSVVRAETCAHALDKLNISSTALHSARSQKQRSEALNQFRSGRRRVLVATDVAARGLDIPQVDLVINFDFPATFVDYVHRVGRTARANRSGQAVSFVTTADIARLHAVEGSINRKLLAHEYNDDVDAVAFHVQEATSAWRLSAAFASREVTDRLQEQRRRYGNIDTESSAPKNKKETKKEEKKKKKKKKEKKNLK